MIASMQRIATAWVITSTLFSASLLLAGFPVVAQARGASSTIPTIVTRSGWDADESLGIVLDPAEEIVRTENAVKKQEENLEALSARDKRCRDNLKNYPDDFRVQPKVIKEDEEGYTFIWSRRYSPKVKLIVIHHTGEANGSPLEQLSGPEQVRSIYYTHTVKNGWGDIGYHYLIDRDGVIYEGRAGGKNIIGAHAYCANTGTLGVAMIGNFQFDEPSEEQLSSLRKLLHYLGTEYDIDLKGRVSFQGQMMPTVVAHRDLTETQCAGRTVQALLPSIRRLAAAGDFDSPLTVPKEHAHEPGEANTLKPVGSTSLRALPRGTVSIKLRLNAEAKSVRTGERIAEITRSNRTITIFQDRSGSSVRTSNDLRADRAIALGDQALFTLTVLAPRKAGTYTLTIGDVGYTLVVSSKK